MTDDALTRKDAEMGRLLPCPFCGESAVKTGANRGNARCNDDECSGGLHAYTIEQWNRRALSIESVREEALEEAAKVCDRFALLTGRVCADEIRALQHSPTRVAEGEVSPLAWNGNRIWVCLDGAALLRAKLWDGKFQVLFSPPPAPESPAKEQPDVPQEKCSYCGVFYPVPVHLHHTLEECRAAKEQPGEQNAAPHPNGSAKPSEPNRVAWLIEYRDPKTGHTTGYLKDIDRAGTFDVILTRDAHQAIKFLDRHSAQAILDDTSFVHAMGNAKDFFVADHMFNCG